MNDGYQKCGSCGASVIWAITKTGKRMPLDAASTDGGLFVIVGMNGPHAIGLHALSAKGRLSTEARHASHFATCPNAATHRKGRSK